MGRDYSSDLANVCVYCSSLPQHCLQRKAFGDQHAMRWNGYGHLWNPACRIAPAANDVPIARDDRFATARGVAVSGSLAGNDALSADGGQALSFPLSFPFFFLSFPSAPWAAVTPGCVCVLGHSHHFSA